MVLCVSNKHILWIVEWYDNMYYIAYVGYDSLSNSHSLRSILSE